MKKYLTGNEVKAIRAKLRISQEKLAKKAGISRYHLHQHENELVPLNRANMSKIVGIFKEAQQDYFKGGDGN